MKDKIIKVIKRVSQPSSMAGITGLGTLLLVLGVPPGTAEAVVAGVTGLAGFLAIVLDDGSNITV
jgi:hypothetical protein